MRDERYGWAVHLLKMCPFIIDGGPTEWRPRRPLSALHANPDRTAWVRLRHFEAAVEHIGKRHADVLFGSDEALSLRVFGDHLDACYEAGAAVMR